MYEALLVIFLFIAIGLVCLIILQKSRGIETGTSFRAEVSSALFGSSGSGNLMTRITAGLATLFFVISLILCNFSTNKEKKGSEWENLSQPTKSEQIIMSPAPSMPNSDIPQ